MYIIYLETLHRSFLYRYYPLYFTLFHQCHVQLEGRRQGCGGGGDGRVGVMGGVNIPFQPYEYGLAQLET